MTPVEKQTIAKAIDKLVEFVAVQLPKLSDNFIPPEDLDANYNPLKDGLLDFEAADPAVRELIDEISEILDSTAVEEN